MNVIAGGGIPAAIAALLPTNGKSIQMVNGVLLATSVTPAGVPTIQPVTIATKEKDDEHRHNGMGKLRRLIGR